MRAQPVLHYHLCIIITVHPAAQEAKSCSQLPQASPQGTHAHVACNLLANTKCTNRRELFSAVCSQLSPLRGRKLFGIASYGEGDLRVIRTVMCSHRTRCHLGRDARSCIERDGRQRGLGRIGWRRTMNARECDSPLHCTLVIDCGLTVLMVPHHLALASMYVSALLVD